MLKNYFKTAWRNIVNNKAYSSINIIGLATGMAIALLISLWIADEISFDSYHKNHKVLAQVMLTQSLNDEYYTGQTIAMPLGKELKSNFSDLFDHLSLSSYNSDHTLAFGDKKIPASGVWVQRDFPEMFTLEVTAGSAGALSDPSSMMISSTIATALFGKVDPVNKLIKLDNKTSFRVGGVYKDLPLNTTFSDAKLLLPWESKENSYMNSSTDWDDHNGQLFVQLKKNLNADEVTKRIKNVPTPHIKSVHEEVMIQPLDKLHLYSEFSRGKSSGGRIQFVKLFGIIGAFVLLLACINFMNLSTARSEKRSKEVGIRKTVGSLRSQLIGQFLGESILVSFIAFVIALVLLVIALPYFNQLAAKQIIVPWNRPLFWLSLTGFTLFTGLIAGSYPAFYLSGFQPIKVLKGTFRAGRGATLPRQVLVVIQFSVSLVLIIGTIIVFRQIHYAKDRPIGYSKEGLITVYMNTPDLALHYDALRADLLGTGVVSNMAQSSQSMSAFNNNNEMHWRGQDPKQVVYFRNVNVTPEFGNTVGWKIVKGRDFSRSFVSDSNAMLINETAMKIIGIKDPVGETMKFDGKDRLVIGVVNDLVTNSPYEPIEPAIFLGDGYLSIITIRIKPGQPMHSAIAGIEPIFKRYNPESPFIYQFNDNEYALKFEAEERIGNLATVFAGFAIFISLLGLFGLASFIAEQRTKEIGVRKVLGADIISLWGLLSKDFIKLVGISFFISVPLAYYSMHDWLQNYNYRTTMPWWIFLVACISILLTTMLTVSYQALKAAMMNPVQSLKTE